MTKITKISCQPLKLNNSLNNAKVAFGSDSDADKAAAPKRKTMSKILNAALIVGVSAPTSYLLTKNSLPVVGAQIKKGAQWTLSNSFTKPAANFVKETGIKAGNALTGAVDKVVSKSKPGKFINKTALKLQKGLASSSLAETTGKIAAETFSVAAAGATAAEALAYMNKSGQEKACKDEIIENVQSAVSSVANGMSQFIDKKDSSLADVLVGVTSAGGTAAIISNKNAVLSSLGAATKGLKTYSAGFSDSLSRAAKYVTNSRILGMFKPVTQSPMVRNIAGKAGAVVGTLGAATVVTAQTLSTGSLAAKVVTGDFHNKA